MNRALLVGINAYPGNELRGCVNDVTDMAEFLTKSCGFQAEEVRLVTDGRATKQAIVDRLGWLLTGASAGDRVFFHYSGHGAQFPVRNAQGDVQRIDECICPVDFDWTEEHALRDKEFHELFSTVPAGVEFVWVSDSCFSGDLARAINKPHQKPKVMPMPADVEWRMRVAEKKRVPHRSFQHVMPGFNVALVSGCTAKQTSADADFAGRFNGALTYYLLQTLEAGDGLTAPLNSVVDRTRKALAKNQYEQDPQLEGSKDIMQLPFLSLKPKAAAA